MRSTMRTSTHVPIKFRFNAPRARGTPPVAASMYICTQRHRALTGVYVGEWQRLEGAVIHHPDVDYSSTTIPSQSFTSRTLWFPIHASSPLTPTDSSDSLTDIPETPRERLRISEYPHGPAAFHPCPPAQRCTRIKTCHSAVYVVYRLLVHSSRQACAEPAGHIEPP